MKRILAALMYVLTLTVAMPAYAEHQLLITDVLGPKEFEAEADFTVEHIKYDQTWRPNGVKTDSKFDSFNSFYSVSAGLGYGLQLNLGIPYDFYDKFKHDTHASTPYTTYTEFKGWGDVNLGLKYRLLGDSKKSFSLVTGLNVKLNSAPNHAGTGTTDVKPYIAASTVVGTNLRPYVWYEYIFRDHDANDSHNLMAGLEYEINKTVTLNAELAAEFALRSATFSSYQSYAARLGSYIQVIRNVYVLPSVFARITTSRTDTAMNIDVGEMRGYGGTIGLYYYFH